MRSASRRRGVPVTLLLVWATSTIALAQPTPEPTPVPAPVPAPTPEPAPAPAPTSTPEAGCTKDIECKGDRICDAGVCKAQPAVAAPVAAPAVVPSCEEQRHEISTRANAISDPVERLSVLRTMPTCADGDAPGAPVTPATSTHDVEAATLTDPGLGGHTCLAFDFLGMLGLGGGLRFVYNTTSGFQLGAIMEAHYMSFDALDVTRLAGVGVAVVGYRVVSGQFEFVPHVGAGGIYAGFLPQGARNAVSVGDAGITADLRSSNGRSLFLAWDIYFHNGVANSASLGVGF